MPSYTGSMTLDFTDTTRYAEWVAAGIVDIELKWVGALIDSPEYNEVKLRMKACNWTDGNPVSSLSDTSKITLPFQAMHNGTDPVVSMTYQSADTAV